jgi:hypothetical protein
MVDLTDSSYNSLLGLVQRFAPVASMVGVPEKPAESMRTSGTA